MDPLIKSPYPNGFLTCLCLELAPERHEHDTSNTDKGNLKADVLHHSDLDPTATPNGSSDPTGVIRIFDCCLYFVSLMMLRRNIKSTQHPPRLVRPFHELGNCLLNKLSVHVLARLNPSATRNQEEKNDPYESALVSGCTLNSASATSNPDSPRPAPKARI